MGVLKKILQIIKWLVVTFVLIIVANSCIQRYVCNRVQPMFFGWGAAVVQTGSMEPNVPVGTLIVIHEQETYEPGDVITYIDYRGWSITHRIISIRDDAVVVQGDANDIPDPTFSKDDIVGKTVYMIPNAGKVLGFLKQPVVIAILLVLFVVSIVWDVVSGKKRKKAVAKTFALKTTSEDTPSVQPQQVLAENSDVQQSNKLVFNTSVRMYTPKGKSE